VPEFPFYFFALANISINDVDGYLVETKRNAPRNHRNVKADTVFAFLLTRNT
jgi:hypothetical protein